MLTEAMSHKDDHRLLSTAVKSILYCHRPIDADGRPVGDY